MSENKNIPEIIYVPEKMLSDIESGTSLITNKTSNLNEVAYIRKSAYDGLNKYNTAIIMDLTKQRDELLKEKEELEKKLSEVNKINFNKPCYCKNQNMTGGLICHGNCRYI